MKKLLYILASLSLFAALLIFPKAAGEAVKSALSMCAQLIIPSLFPFFIAVNLMSELGAARTAANALSPIASKLLGISGYGAAAFIIGATGGYPLGAAYIAQLRKKLLVSQKEASLLLIFCNNSGPAFIIGAVGIGVFSSVSLGFFLYAVHIIAALIVGIIISPKAPCDICYDEAEVTAPSFSSAFTASVKRSAEAVISICAFIAAFSALNGILGGMGIISSLVGEMAHVSGFELSWCRALLAGILELGNGIGAISGFEATPQSLALAAFILSWGGLSVHFQTFAMIDATDIKTARYVIGRLFTALIAAALALLGAVIMF